MTALGRGGFLVCHCEAREGRSNPPLRASEGRGNLLPAQTNGYLMTPAPARPPQITGRSLHAGSWVRRAVGFGAAGFT